MGRSQEQELSEKLVSIQIECKPWGTWEEYSQTCEFVFLFGKSLLTGIGIGLHQKQLIFFEVFPRPVSNPPTFC